MTIDPFQLHTPPVDAEHPILDPDLPESHREGQHLLTGEDIQPIQIRQFRIPQHWFLDLQFCNSLSFNHSRCCPHHMVSGITKFHTHFLPSRHLHFTSEYSSLVVFRQFLFVVYVPDMYLVPCKHVHVTEDAGKTPHVLIL
ncbi:hypothetical protein D3C71_1268240 [compost metagenome]